VRYTVLEKPDESVFAEERKSMIVDHINENVKATVAELSEMFGVSSATIRNDLRDLEEARLIKRTHGGAISNKSANFELNSYEKAVERVEHKRAIARAALEYVSEGDTIALDTGTTTYELAKLLTKYKNITVVTNDLQIAFYLEQNSQAQIIMAGGRIRRNFHCTTGDRAIDTIADLNVDKIFLAANGISVKKGVTTPNLDMAEVKKTMIRMADKIILLTDSTKLDRSAFVKFADFDDVNVLITDDEADPDYLEEFRKKEIKVIAVSK